MPSFDLNRQVVEKAERFGFDFALSMIKLHGFWWALAVLGSQSGIIHPCGGACSGNHPHSVFRLGRGANSLFHYFQRHSIHWPPLSRIGPLREIRSMRVRRPRGMLSGRFQGLARRYEKYAPPEPPGPKEMSNQRQSPQMVEITRFTRPIEIPLRNAPARQRSQ